jgi:hypothetical protein
LKSFILSIAVLLGCAKAPDADEPEPASPTIAERFADAQDRLASEFIENGWVVSRGTNGEPEHQGDALIWTGLWLGAADCAAALPSELMLRDMIRRHQGALVRYEPLGEYAGGREATLDGALGLYRGIAERVTRCPETRPEWLDIVALHYSYMEASGGHLNPNSDARVIPEFTYVLARLLDHVSGGDPLHRDGDRVDRLGVQSAAWAMGVAATHAAAFRVHLALLALQTLELSGEDIGRARDALCAVTPGMDLPTLDHWCGRGDLAAWVDGFEYDSWEFRHQRAGAWESPDGDGDRTPGLDFLVAIRQAYAMP